MGRGRSGFANHRDVDLATSHSSAFCFARAKAFMGLLICVSLVLSALSLRAASITDSFTNAQNWNAPFADAGKGLVLTNGRMNFISSTTAGGGSGTTRTSPFLTTTQDWSIKVDVHIDPFTITSEDHGVSLFLGVGKTGDYFNTHVLLGFDRDWWDPAFYGVNDDVLTNGTPAPGLFNVNLLPSADATLRFDYQATTSDLRYYCDTDGVANGVNWVLLGTANLGAGTYDLNFGPTDTFTVLLAGWSNLQVVTNGQAYFDNLEITYATTTPPTPPILSLLRSNGVSLITITGEAGSRFALEHLTVFAPGNNWTTISTNTLTALPLVISDVQSAGNVARFYRARWVP